MLSGSGDILGHVVLSQDVHEVFGGVVPELAARAHLRQVDAVVRSALEQARLTLDDVEVFGVTAGPGLIGALLVGVSWTKSVAFALGKPWVPVHHMEGHLFGPCLEDPDAEPPFVSLLVSGGHTLLLHATGWGDYELLGETRDDAAGEAFDKVAKLLGLPYPGGPAVERLAATAEAPAARLPRPLLRRDQSPDESGYYDFSFSGLKTAVVERTKALDPEVSDDAERAALAAAFQEAAVDVLASKTMRAVEQTGCRRVLLGGGVSANRALRAATLERLGDGGRLFHASPRLSLDNGAMIARAALFRYGEGEVGAADASASAALPFPGLRPRATQRARPGSPTGPMDRA